MSSIATEQTERAFQKQDGIFWGRKRLLARKAAKNGQSRYWRNIGLGFKTPREAIEGNYVDNKCPFTGDVSIRGRILKGVVMSTKMKRTVIIRRDYLHYVRKYNRYEKRHKNVPAHCTPAFQIAEGDRVVIGQCRPLSKTVRFNVLKIEQKSSTAKKAFTVY